MTGRLIDADRLKRSFQANTPIAFQDCVPGIHAVINLEPTVEAIPISFIEEMKQKFGNQIDEYGGIAEHEEWVDNIVVRLNALEQLLNEWAERKGE